MLKLNLGLVKGRHNIPQVSEYIFEQEINPLDVNGLEKEATEKLASLFNDDTCYSFAYIPNPDELGDVHTMYRGTLNLYVTGLTVALIAVLNACYKLGIDVVVYHYNRDNNCYYAQQVLNPLVRSDSAVRG